MTALRAEEVSTGPKETSEAFYTTKKMVVITCEVMIPTGRYKMTSLATS
jgi:hypothetical protein